MSPARQVVRLLLGQDERIVITLPDKRRIETTNLGDVLVAA